MELKQLQYFVVSVDMGSFQNAAKMLYTTQPHVSKTVKALEDELHLKLLVREARGVKMTAEGKRVYDYASTILKQSELISRINEENGTNRLAIASMPAPRLSQLCACFYAEQNENLQFTQRQGCLEDVLGFMHKHVAEIGFVYVSEHQMSAFNQTLDYKRLAFVPMKKAGMSLLVGKKHPLFNARTVDDAQLKTLKYVQYEEDYFSLIHHPGHLNESIHRFGKIDNIVTTNSDDCLYFMLQEGGLCHLGCDIVQQKFDRTQIRCIPLSGSEATIQFGYIKRRRDTLSKITEKLVDYLGQNLGGADN